MLKGKYQSNYIRFQAGSSCQKSTVLPDYWAFGLSGPRIAPDAEALFLGKLLPAHLPSFL
jgi:hypothetical protein